jgi:1,4-dihydroxy-2-naphthoyl-CoA hydrolase
VSEEAPDPAHADPEAGQMLAALQGGLGELASSMGITVTEADSKELRASMPVAGNRQPYGLLHGGASAVLAETLGSVHAAILAPAGRFPVGIELSCSHHRSATEGSVHAISRPVNVGRTLATLAVTIRDDRDRLCCTARLTCLYREAI